jgi:hypothetical protein
MARSSGTVWDEIRGGDGATVDVDPTDATILYSMSQYASSIARRKGSGGFQGLAAGLPMGAMCFTLHYQVHPTIPTTLLASCGSLWRTLTNEPPGDWRMIFPLPGTPQPRGNIVRSAVDGSADVYYAATDGGEVYAGDQGASWERVFSVFADCAGATTSITAMIVDPDDPATIYVATGREGSCRVVRLRRLQPGSLAMSNEDITMDLPAGIRVSALAVDRMNLGTIYAGTLNRGVYRGRSSAGAWRWDRYSDGLPFATAIVDLVSHPTTGVLRAGTFGRGAFAVNTDHPIGSVLAIEGIPIFVRVHDAGGFGPPTDRIDGEVVVRLDTAPRKAFGFQLRANVDEKDHAGMLALLRSAFARGRRVRIEYVRTGLRNGRAFRTAGHRLSRRRKRLLLVNSADRCVAFICSNHFVDLPVLQKRYRRFRVHEHHATFRPSSTTGVT